MDIFIEARSLYLPSTEDWLWFTFLWSRLNVELWTITLSTWEIAERLVGGATRGQHISDNDLAEKNPFKLPLLGRYMYFCYKDVVLKRPGLSVLRTQMGCWTLVAPTRRLGCSQITTSHRGTKESRLESTNRIRKSRVWNWPLNNYVSTGPSRTIRRITHKLKSCWRTDEWNKWLTGKWNKSFGIWEQHVTCVNVEL